MKKYDSKYYKINAPNNRTVHIHIDYEKSSKKIKNVFIRIPPIGDEINILAAIFGAILSDYFDSGGDINKAIKHLHSAKSGSRAIEDNGEIVETVPHAIAMALKQFKKDILDEREKGGGDGSQK